MEMSTEIGEIAGALAKAQSGLGKLIASKTAKLKGSAKGSGKAYEYSYTYADLADALEACRATLNAEGISVLQLPATPQGNGIEVTTMLAHSSGQWLRSDPLFMPVKGGAQDVGSAITYARRYQLLAMVGLAPEDDDGAAAQSAQPDSWGDRQRPPVRSERKRDAVGPRCRGSSWLGDLGQENERLLSDIAGAEQIGMGEAWDKMLVRIHLDPGPYVQADGKPPQCTGDLSKEHGQAFKKQARAWLAELANG